MAGMHTPPWHRPLRPALQQGGSPGPHAALLAVHAAAVGAQVPPTQLPEQHCDTAVHASPSTVQTAALGGVDEAHATKCVPRAHAAPL
jgi:hypothetical protein